MPDKLMSTERQAQLYKAAESTINLMNIGVEGNAALAKVAEDSGMNDNEVKLVAHAVNNSRQLAHLQSSDTDSKEDAFPLVDPDKVRPHGELQPATNADPNTGDRYGSQEEPSNSADQKFHENDALDTKEEMDKQASASYEEDGDYRLKADTPDYLSELRTGWAIDKTAGELPVSVGSDPFRKISKYRIAIEEAECAYQKKMGECYSTIETVAGELRRTDAPAWEGIEKAAFSMGADKQTLGIIYGVSDVEKFGGKRADLTKVGSDRQFVDDRTYQLAQLCVHANTLWKEASDVRAAGQEMRRRYKEAEAKLLKVSNAGGNKPREPNKPHDPFESGHVSGRVDSGKMLSELGSEIDKTMDMLPEDTIQSAVMDVGTAGPEKSLEEVLPIEMRQSMADLDSRVELKEIMKDPGIKGANPLDVIEAYDQVKGLNPNLAKSEIISFIRQHLATDGGVPLDLQLRASRAHLPTSGD